MATVTVRHLDEEVRRKLKRRAAENNRSMEAEARAILSEAVTDVGLAQAWLDTAKKLRGDEIPLPERSQPREVDLG